MEQGVSGSGARYLGNGKVFWEHQGEATWQTSPTARASTCKRVGSG
jgi:membrane-bound inhibitor of C-type lysozyme